MKRRVCVVVKQVMRFQSGRKPMLATAVNPKKLLVMLTCLALFLYVYVTYASGSCDTILFFSLLRLDCSLKIVNRLRRLNYSS